MCEDLTIMTMRVSPFQNSNKGHRKLVASSPILRAGLSSFGRLELAFSYSSGGFRTTYFYNNLGMSHLCWPKMLHIFGHHAAAYCMLSARAWSRSRTYDIKVRLRSSARTGDASARDVTSSRQSVSLRDCDAKTQDAL